jgi:ribonuclease HII
MDLTCELFLMPIATDGSPDIGMWLAGRIIAGIDEAGRGPLAGPVVVAGVILHPHRLPDGLDDSKKLSPRRREQLWHAISSSAIATAIVAIASATIDRLNILQATYLGMRQCAAILSNQAVYFLVDGRDYPLTLPGRAIIGGDARSPSIAAASIIAKVYRDRLMLAADQLYPAYGFARHKGYPTTEHRDKVKHLGPTALHRRSFLTNIWQEK